MFSREREKLRVGVVRGGPSNEYDVSLKTGATILKHLSSDKYYPKDILISREGDWHMDGLERDPNFVLSQLDVVLNALHGFYGEDGKIQHLFESHGIPFSGSGAFASSLGMNKALSKSSFKKAGIKTPLHRLISWRNDIGEEVLSPEFAYELFRSFPLPFIVKPVSSGSSVGVSLVKNFDSLVPAMESAFEHDDQVMIEEFIPGTEATVGIIEDFRGQRLYALPPVEIRHKKEIFDYDAKYGGVGSGTEEIVPGNFSEADKVALEEAGRLVHDSLGLAHYSRIDFILSPRRGIYVLEANTLPGLTEESLIPKALSAVGVPLHRFFDHLVSLALKRE